MSTSHKTRQYWVEKAKGWAESRLTHPDYGGSPQLDEFNEVMDDLLALSNHTAVNVNVTLKPRDLVGWLMEQAQTWIPLSERMPEIRDEDGHKFSDWVFVDWMYRIENPDEPYEDWREIEKAHLLDDVWHAWDGHEIPAGDEHAPTKWMPIPKV